LSTGAKEVFPATFIGSAGALLAGVLAINANLMDCRNLLCIDDGESL
jgi:hypothetical protein